MPLEWAATQSSLGGVLWRLGGRESGTGRLKEAVAAFRAALEEWTRERVSLGWATTQMNLGSALRALAERESGTARLEEGVAAHDGALAVFLAAGTERYVEMCREDRDRAMVLIAQRRG